ncbi:MAG TPA: hypothetical protein VGO43_13155 [Pyrinomonadaceae bacterium]|jgi:hypothetical protein|nr:hypothetical protein [Pyrinomonadaceae bacterium]
MKHTEEKNTRIAGYGVDTLFVLFFLALEYGRSAQLFSIDGTLMATTMGMVLVLPYFLPSRVDRPMMSRWLAVRGGVTLAALMLGVIYGKSTGAAVPGGFSTVPMTFLILASMVSCYIQFYGLMRLRPAK